MLESNIKVRCNNHHVCPQVIGILQGIGFTRIRDIRESSTSFDISARYRFKDGQNREEIINDIFEKSRGKVHGIQITAKRSRFF